MADVQVSLPLGLTADSGLPLFECKCLCFVTQIHNHGCPFRLGCLWRAGYLNWPNMFFPFPPRHQIGKTFIQTQDLLALSKPLLPLACLAAMSPFRGLRVQQVVMYLISGSGIDICPQRLHWLPICFLIKCEMYFWLIKSSVAQTLCKPDCSSFDAGSSMRLVTWHSPKGCGWFLTCHWKKYLNPVTCFKNLSEVSEVLLYQGLPLWTSASRTKRLMNQQHLLGNSNVRVPVW